MITENNKPDISNLVISGHFYFGLTLIRQTLTWD